MGRGVRTIARPRHIQELLSRQRASYHRLAHGCRSCAGIPIQSVRLENRYVGQQAQVTYRMVSVATAPSAQVTLSKSAMPGEVPFISQTVMDQTYQSMGSSTGSEIGEIQKRAQKTQPALTRFVYDHALVLREDSAGVGIYVYHVILETFGTLKPRVSKVKPKHIAGAWETLRKERHSVREDDIAASPEPAVLQYAFDALTENDEDVVLSEEEREIIYTVLGAAIECLHNAYRRKQI